MSESTDGPNPRKLWGLMERVQLQWENKEGVFVFSTDNTGRARCPSCDER